MIFSVVLCRKEYIMDLQLGAKHIYWVDTNGGFDTNQKLIIKIFFIVTYRVDLFFTLIKSARIK